MEQMREAVARAIITANWPSLSDNDVDEMLEGYLFDADAALALMQPEIDRRVAEERVKLLERLREPSRAMQIAGVEASPWSEPRQLSCGQWGRESFNTDECAAIWQAMLAQFEKEQQP